MKLDFQTFWHIFGVFRFYFKTLFVSLEGRGGEGKGLRGEKYEGKLRNLSKNLKELFFRE